MPKPAYYNENDSYCVEWLKNLVAADLIPPGEVDDRSIVDVTAADLRGFGQCHFFAGIGGFGLACRLAAWPDDRQIWTGGFPCQPFSVAGRQVAQEDDRHLWPVLSRLIEQKRPAVFIGENVAGIIDLALDGVLFDLEAAGYASRAFVVPACAVNAPHRRDRVWIAARSMAYPVCEGRLPGAQAGVHSSEESSGARDGEPQRCGVAGDVEHAASIGRGEGRAEPVVRGGRAAAAGAGVSHGDVGHANGAGSQERHGVTGDARQERPAAVGAGWREPWSGGEYREGADGKARRVEPGIRLLAHGVSARVAKLRAGGNAIVPQIAAEIIKAVMAVRP